ncbi:trypsin-like serine protease with C-terminal PDZ domain [Xenococcus sp. PCC 7305]|uniref:S1 family peptidase n=1 Tax=Xenococcus sp. PCC 7305 TaxID=102125 RepID=UPI0002ACB8BF|nr:serine protease [Xenococcus sp. PCC 7305]ELS01235.1 trypsin-like serine protease with C-terminal PDZ domain [Xenococcus sp. PCC 7305]
MVYLDHGDLPKKLALPANFVPLKKEKTIFSREQLEQKAKSITVKVLSGEGWGSGIIISQANNVYTVITNYHVLIFSHDKTYQIQTPDGQVYRGDVLNTVDFGDYDLALLQFSSDREYEVASLSPIDFNPLVSEKAEVFSGGFPLEIENQQQAKGFYFNNGHLVRFSDLNFGGGYQIGYTNSIKKGMSGGPLLNKRGEIIGINGVHKYPLWGNPYLFSDGSLASEAQQEDMSQFSWAITVNSFLELAPQFLVPNN